MSQKPKLYNFAAIVIAIVATAAFAGDWPNFHGPDRTNKSRETGLLTSWPQGGPTLLWSASGAGAGYSGVSVADGVIYTAGSKSSANYVFAYDLTGKPLWERRVGAEWEASGSFSFARAYQGSRGTPTVSGGMVYYLSDRGNLVALDAKTGAERWSVDVHRRYETTIPVYGYSESPLVIGDRLYVAVFGKKHTVVCFNRNNGNVIWEGGHVGGNGGFSSLVPIESAGVKQLVSFTADFLFGVSVENGSVLWTVPVRNSHGLNCTDIIYHDGHVFASSGYGFGSMLVKLSAGAGGRVTAEQVYKTDLMDNHHGGIVFHNGHVYGGSHRRGWFCLDFRTGRQMWNAPGKGSIVFAENMLYLYDEEGKMSLVKAQPGSFETVSSFEVPSGGRGAYWAHPAISNGVLYLRHADKIFAYDIKRR
ncbi:MAG: PQQ-like beta-propeller repeat protein [Chitinispirillales bacterium]|jgi:outer membrane protein assembly factor BamB|nr:PQQ-like beta-propeller repeat protein [Chitinispirillales bacterium]